MHHFMGVYFCFVPGDSNFEHNLLRQMECPKPGSSDTTGGMKCAPCEDKAPSGLKVYSALELEKV